MDEPKNGTELLEDRVAAPLALNQLLSEKRAADKETTTSLKPPLLVVRSRSSGEPRPRRRAQSPLPSSSGGEDDEVDEAEETYPEGGREAWLVVLGCWLALVSSLGPMNTIATLQAYISTHQLSGYSQGDIGWIFSLYTFLAFFLGVYIGPLFDMYGPRWLVVAGTLTLFVSFMLLSFCTGTCDAAGAAFFLLL